MRLLDALSDLLFARRRPTVSVRRRISRKQHVENLRAAIAEGERRLQTMQDQVPPDRACCDTCWLNACMPGYRELTAKQERRRKTLQELDHGHA